MSESVSQGKSYSISKQEVWEAHRRVKANKGAPGVDGQTIAEFEINLKGNRPGANSASAGPVVPN